MKHKPSGWKNFFAVIGVIFVILFLYGLFFPSEEQTTQSTIQSNVLPNNSQKENVQDNIKQNIVWVKYEVTGKSSDGSYFETSASGSGVIYYKEDSKMQVLTNRHVIDCEYGDSNCYQRLSENIHVRTQDGKLHKVSKVLYAPHGLDMAVLVVNLNTSNTYRSSYIRKDSLRLGENVIAVGYPSFSDKVLEFSISKGEITNFRDLIMDDGFGFNAIDSDAYTYFGSSGGGLFDGDGNLIGINTWLAGTQTSIAIRIDTIENFENWDYCDSDSYTEGDYCVEYCEREQVLGSDGRCYDVCDSYYCKSQIPEVNDPRCSDNPTYVPGSDNYCHAACTINSYCNQGSICYKNQCLSCAYGTYLYEDGTCRKN
ncbi:MAG: serine protease [Nanoarchaeota archaeon]|nr:serine protease [Nanoarchaeota archaeon]